MTRTMPKLREIYARRFSCAKGNWDIYIIFMEKAFDLLCNSGVLTFITPDKWISKPFGEAIRTKLRKNIVQILAAGRDVFQSAIVDSIITFFTKQGDSVIRVFTKKNKNSLINFENNVEKTILDKPYALDIIFSSNIELLGKIRSNWNTLMSSSYVCENACATSDCYKLKQFIYSLRGKTEFDKKNQYKIINTGTIGKFYSKWDSSSMKYLKDTYCCPVVDKVVFHKNFTNSYGQKVGKPKLIIKGLTLLDASIDFSGDVIPGKSTMVISVSDVEKLKILSAFINSKITFFYVSEKYSSCSYNGGINFTKDMINNLPFPFLDEIITGKITMLVDEVLRKKEENIDADCSVEYSAIDNIFYCLFGLTDKEIEIVEKNC